MLLVALRKTNPDNNTTNQILLQEELITILDLLVADGLPGRGIGTPPPPENAFDSAAVRAFFRRVGCEQLACQHSPGGMAGDVAMRRMRMEEWWPSMVSEKQRFFSAMVAAQELQ